MVGLIVTQRADFCADAQARGRCFRLALIVDLMEASLICADIHRMEGR